MQKDFYKNQGLEIQRTRGYSVGEEIHILNLKDFQPTDFVAKAQNFGVDTDSEGVEDILIQKMLQDYAIAVTISMSHTPPNRHSRFTKGVTLYEDSEFVIEDLCDSIYERKGQEVVHHENPAKFSGDYDSEVNFILSREGYEKITGKPFDGHKEKFPVLGTYYASDKEKMLYISEVRPGRFSDEGLQETIRKHWNLK